jgi:hypothetical protein
MKILRRHEFQRKLHVWDRYAADWIRDTFCYTAGHAEAIAYRQIHTKIMLRVLSYMS